jgi:hypothetical protein
VRLVEAGKGIVGKLGRKKFAVEKWFFVPVLYCLIWARPHPEMDQVRHLISESMQECDEKCE